MKRPQLRRPSVGTALGALALFVALGGTTMAAKGTNVNTADPVTAKNVAGVNSRGQLKNVSTKGAFSVYKEIYDVQAVTNNVIIPATTATVALDRVDIAPWSGTNLRRFVYLEQFGVPAGGSCDSPSVFRIVGVYEIGPGTVPIDEPNIPMILKKFSTAAAYCLIAQVYPSAATDGAFNYFVASGTVVSGSLPPGSATTARPAGGTNQPSAPQGIDGP